MISVKNKHIPFFSVIVTCHNRAHILERALKSLLLQDLALTKNAGILASSGLFITFLDSDDEYKPDHLSLRKAMLEEYTHLDLLHGGVSIIGDPYVPDMNNPDQLIHLSECIIGGTFVFSATAIHGLNGFDNVSYGDDTKLFEKAEQAGLSIAKTDYPSYVYHRDMPDSLCNIRKES